MNPASDELSSLQLKTRVARYVQRKDGTWNLEWEGHNLITTNGKGLILDRLLGNAVAAPSAMGVGSGTTAPALADTQLQGASNFIQLFDDGTGGKFASPSRSGLTNSYFVTYGTGVANFDHRELAIFNGTVNGTSTMLNRAALSSYVKTSANAVAYLYQLTQL